MPYQVRNATRGTLLGDRIEEARTFSRRFMGLMGVSKLAFGHGLHIVPCNSVHSFFMQITFDALFLDKSLIVVHVEAAMLPWRVTRLCSEARSVLELPAGTAALSNTRVGDRLEMTPATALP
jgi:uncharacterized protein